MKETITALPTEQNNPRTVDIDRVPTDEMMRLLHGETKRAVEAMSDALPALAALADEAAKRLSCGGRMFYAGAGTSGRIGVLDASELPATYGVEPSLVTALIPEGYDTVYDARLGDEDNEAFAVEDLKAQGLCAKDIVVGIAASGRTPYTRAALRFAASCGAFAAAIVNVPASQLAKEAHLTVVIPTGAEPIQGSTRMNAGTTQKLALNMLSTAVMIRLGKVYQNRMVEITAINDKLEERGVQMLRELTGASENACREALTAADGHVKTATAMLLLSCDADEARRRLAACGGRLTALLKEETL